jgi:hypothetical protein
MPNWQPMPTMMGIQKGKHYLFSIFSDLDQPTLMIALADDWSQVNSLTPGGASFGAMQAWRGDVTAGHDLPTGPTQVGQISIGGSSGTIEYLAMYVDASSPAPPPTPGPPGPPGPPVPPPHGPPPPVPPPPPPWHNPEPPPAPSGGGGSSVVPMIAIIVLIGGIAVLSGRRRS